MVAGCSLIKLSLPELRLPQYQITLRGGRIDLQSRSRFAFRAGKVAGERIGERQIESLPSPFRDNLDSALSCFNRFWSVAQLRISTGKIVLADSVSRITRDELVKLLH